MRDVDAGSERLGIEVITSDAITKRNLMNVKQRRASAACVSIGNINLGTISPRNIGTCDCQLKSWKDTVIKPNSQKSDYNVN